MDLWTIRGEAPGKPSTARVKTELASLGKKTSNTSESSKVGTIGREESAGRGLVRKLVSRVELPKTFQLRSPPCIQFLPQ